MIHPVDDELRRINGELKRRILRHLPVPGKQATAVKGLTLSRRQEINKADNCFGTPSVAAIVQGGKCALIGDREYRYKEGQFCITGVDLPSAFYILHPSEEKPFLSVILDLDSQLISRLAMEMPPASEKQGGRGGGLSIGELDADLLQCFLRLVELLDNSELIRICSPMVIREIHYLLLAVPQGESLRQLNTLGTQSNMIAQAISWLKDNYKEPLHVDELARRANMSSSTFHRHFKEITGLSPLQFHKQLRLHEAQRLMVLENRKASSVSLLVGYESDTQFNREYKRLFGEPPYRDKLQRQTFLQ